MKKSFLRSIGFAFAIKGVGIAVKTQFNFRLQLAILLLTILLGILFSISTTEWCLLIIACSMVLAAELLNTAIEFLVNHVQPDFHEAAGNIKDLAAGAVLVASFGAVLIGLLIFAPRVATFI